MLYTSSSVHHRNGRHHPSSPARRRRNGNGHHDPRPISGRSIAHCSRSASQRAAIAAELALEHVRLERPTIRQAAVLLGVSVPYVHLALHLSDEARERVVTGAVSLSDAAKANGLATEFLAASPEVTVAFGRTVGTAMLWDGAIEPAL
jgi:hypothetical protein